MTLNTCFPMLSFAEGLPDYDEVYTPDANLEQITTTPSAIDSGELGAEDEAEVPDAETPLEQDATTPSALGSDGGLNLLESPMLLDEITIEVTGTITPSTTPGSSGGVELTVAADENDVKIYSFEAEADKLYSAVIYKVSGDEYAELLCSFSDEAGAGTVDYSYGMGPLGSLEDVPKDVYSTSTASTYYLNVQNDYGYAGTFIIKIYSNTPSAPILTPATIPDGTDEPFSLEITSTDGGAIYYANFFVDDVIHIYSDPIIIDRDSMIFAYVVKDGIYSEATQGSYWLGNIPGYPEILPSETVQSLNTQITITGADEGEIIYYTTDDSDPYNSTSREIYNENTSNVLVTEGVTIKAIIKNAKGLYGGEEWKTYVIGTAKPSISNIPGSGGPGVYGDAFNAILVSSEGATIYYTLDGTTATASSSVYTDPIPINQNTRLSTIAVLNGIQSEEYNVFLSIITPRNIIVGDILQGISFINRPEWFVFDIEEEGSYSINLTPDDLINHCFKYRNYFGTINNPIVLYSTDSEGNQNEFIKSINNIDNDEDIKYNFAPGKYKIQISSYKDDYDFYSIQIVQGVKPPTSSIPMTSYSGEEWAYIKEGSLTLSTEEDGGKIFYTIDGSTPATSVGGATYEFISNNPINLSTTESYADITVKAITVVNESASVVKTFKYRVIPAGIDLTGIKYYYYYYYYYYELFVNGQTYDKNSFDLNSQYPNASNAGSVISKIDYKIKLSDGNGGYGEWIDLGTATGSFLSNDLAYNKNVTWDWTMTPFSGDAILAADSYDVAGNLSHYEIPIKIVMSAPTTPENLTATPGEGSITLNWGASTYVTGRNIYYIIYRGTSPDNIEKYNYAYRALTYTEAITENNTQVYYYSVKAYSDNYGDGRGSDFSNIVSASPIQDTTQPEISSIYLPNNGVVNSASNLYIYASDNSGLKEIKAEVSPKDQNSWQTANILTGTNLTVMGFNLASLPDLEDGVYDLKATVTDYYDNTASSQVEFELDNTPPPAVELQAEGKMGSINLSFSKSSEDVSYYKIYYKDNGAATFTYLLQVSGDTNIYYHDLSGSIGETYDYKIIAYDVAGNESQDSNIASATVQGYSPTISIVPDAARPGDVLNITVEGFLGNEYVNLYVDEEYVQDILLDEDGKSTFTYNIPSGTTGSHRFKVEGQTSLAKVLKNYTITDYNPVVTAPLTANAGDTVTISVDQFGWLAGYSNKTVEIYIDGEEKTQIYINNDSADGIVFSESTTCQIPYTAYGTIQIMAESSDGYSAICTIDVAPSSATLTSSTEGKKSGETVTLTASGFAPNELIYFYKSGVYNSYVYADGQGYATKNIILSPSDVGNIIFEVSGQASLLNKLLIYNVLPARLEIVGPESVYSSTSTNFSISGLKQYEKINIYIDGVYTKAVWGSAGQVINASLNFAEIGNHLITAVGETTGMTASIYCEVKLPAALNPILVATAEDGSFTTGKQVTLSASGFKASEQIKFYLNNLFITQVNADVNGSATTTHTIATNENLVFAATGQTSILTAISENGVLGHLGLSFGGSAKPGENITVTITGNYTLDNCKVYLDGYSIGAAESFVAGDITLFNYQLPYSTSIGEHSLAFVTANGETGKLLLTVIKPETTITVEPISQKISLAGFAANEPIDLKINGSAISGAVALADGSYEYTPETLYGVGEYLITARGTTSNFYEQGTFTVQEESAAMVIDKINARPGDSINIELSNFNSLETLKIYISGQEVSSVFADELGAAVAIVTIPVNQSPGTAEVKVIGLKYGKIVQNNITINATEPFVSILPSSGSTIRGGESVTINLSGYPSNANISFYLDAVKINVEGGSTTTNSEGALTVTYNLPISISNGAHNLIATGSNASYAVEFDVEAQTSVLLLSKTEGKVGDLVTISGNNYLMATTGDTTVQVEFGNSIIETAAVVTEGSFSVGYIIPEETLDGIYTVKIITSEQEEASASFRIDSTAPTIPVVIVQSGVKSITIDWIGVHDSDLAGYKVYRKLLVTDDWTEIADLEKTRTTYTQTLGQGIEIGTTYIYGVSSYDRLENESGKGEATGRLAIDTTKPSGYFYVQNSNVSLKEGSYNFVVNGSDNQAVSKITVNAKKFTGTLDSQGNKIYETETEFWSTNNPDYSSSSSNSVNYNLSFVKNIVVGNPVDGEYLITLNIEDFAGNAFSTSNTFYIDTVLPSKPTSIVATGSAGSITLVWTSSNSQDVTGYEIYMAESQEDLSSVTVPTKTVGAVSAASFETQLVAPLYFRLRAYDSAGNKSEFSDVAWATATVDIVNPVMKQISPSDMYASRADYLYMILKAQDNFRIKEFIIEYKQVSGADYSTLATLTAGTNFNSSSLGADQDAGYNWNTAGLSGNYNVRVKAVDYSGNSSDYMSVTYRLDKTSPAPPTTVTAVGETGSVTVTWDGVSDEDLWGYYIYRQLQGGTPENLFTYIASKNKTEARTYKDYNVEIGESYIYGILSRDDLYNESIKTYSLSAEVGNFTPQINLSVNGVNVSSVYAGDTLKISATGFKPYEMVSLYMDYNEASTNTVILNRWTDINGAISIDWRYVVNTMAGSHNIALKGNTSGAVESIAFTTLAPTILPAAPTVVNTSNTGVLSMKISDYVVSGAVSYNIYRRATKTLDDTEEEPLALLAAKVKTLSYTDLTVNNSKKYYYSVEALDGFDNPGQKTESVGITPLQDTNNPTAALNNHRDGNNLTIYAVVSDNVSVTNISFAYKNEDNSVNGSIGTPLSPNTGRDKSVTVTQDWDTTDLADGNYIVTATVIDRNGNQVEKDMTIKIRSEATTYEGIVSATAEALRVKISWTKSSDEELSSYFLYRKTSQDNITWTEWTKIASTSLLTYTDYGLSATTYYKYGVAVYDRFGKTTEIVAMTSPESGYISPLSDTQTPVIGSFSPSTGSVINKITNISILASDNVGVSKIELFLENSLGDTEINGVKYNKIGESISGNAGFGTIAFNTIPISDGSVVVLARATDGSNNSSTKQATYTIDNTAPPIPSLKAESAELSVSLTVKSGGAASDLSHYNIYTASSENGSYSLLTSAKAGTYIHKEALSSNNWYYATSVDTVGNESLKTIKTSAIPGGDITVPVISLFTPASDTPLRGVVSLYAKATDNLMVSSIAFEYKKSDSSTWTEISKLTSFDDQGGASYSWNTVAESNGFQLSPDGSYEVRAVALDATSNQGILVGNYSIANDPPTPPTGLEVYSGQWQLVVSYNGVSGAAFSYYKIYRKLSSESEWTYLAQTTSNVYVDKGLDPANSYDYKVSVVNDLGRESNGVESTGIISDTMAHNAKQQTTKPIIRLITPTNYYFNGSVDLETLVEDDIGISSFTYEYRLDGAAETDPWQPISIISGVDIVKKNINLTPDYEGFEEALWSGSTTWDANSLEPGAYQVKVTVKNMGGEDSVSAQTRVYNLVKTNSVVPTISNVNNPQTGGKLILQMSIPVATVANPTPMDYFTLYRSTQDGFEISEATKIADKVRGNYVDIGLDNETTYYYIATLTDLAGNIGTQNSQQVAGVPTAESGLSIRSSADVLVQPDYPVIGRENTITAKVFNAGYATANGTVLFSYSTDSGVNWTEIGSTVVNNIVGNTSSDVKIKWTPDSIMAQGTMVQIKAVVSTSQGTTELIGERAKAQTQEFSANKAPVAAMSIKYGDAVVVDGGIAETGAIMNFSADGSVDFGSGYISEYKWQFGDGKSLAGKNVSYGYVNPGTRTVKLTVTDNLGTITEISQSIIINDNRPDLFVESLTWMPEDPNENDVMTIRATIGNKGKGPSNLGFLVGFYIDNKYMGYTKVADNTVIPVGGTTEAVFTWVATAGEHIVTAKANDILDALKEIDKTNNSMTKSMSSEQVDFVDIKVNDISWTGKGEGRVDFNSEEEFQYTATISNESETRNVNEPFFVELSIDGEYVTKKQINSLAFGTSTTVSFPVQPYNGAHEILISADVTNPVHLELDKTNNQLEMDTETFNVEYPNIVVNSITWEPQETKFAKGTSLTFSVKVTNDSAFQVSNSFKVDLSIGGLSFRNVTVEGLSAGETKTITGRWEVIEPTANADGTKLPFEVLVTIDKEKAVMANSVVSSEQLPAFTIIYPDLNITSVQIPTQGNYGNPMTFIASVGNESLATIFTPFTVGLYARKVGNVDWKQVAGYTMQGLKGYSTAFVPLTYTPKEAGTYEYMIVADNYNAIKQQTVLPERPRIRKWITDPIVVEHQLIMEAIPNSDMADDDMLAVLYSSNDDLIPIEAKFYQSSNMSSLLGPDDGVAAHFTLKSNSEIKREGELSYLASTGLFTANIPIAVLSSGVYTLTIEGGQSGGTNLSETVNVRVIQNTIANVSTDRSAYQIGEAVIITGNFTFSDGNPMANETVVLDLKLLPRLSDPRIGRDERGNEILLQYQGEHIRFIETDEYGNFAYTFYPRYGEAGQWDIDVFAYQRLLGNAASTSFDVKGMVAEPSSLEITAVKNSSFSKTITFKNAALAGDNSLTGLTAIISKIDDNNIIATMDTT
ncbi:MAG: CARDB domain-containing protein, partial [Sedimentibacter sp.]